MAKNIDANLNTIKGIFSNAQGSVLGKDGVFIIPEYQRAYNWKFNEQCDKLWQDIEAFIEHKKNETYFLGSIIINSDNYKLHVIDGQQRITTFMLLLKALLVKINELLLNIADDTDAKDIKNALKNRRNEIIKCLYLIDEDDVQSIVDGEKPLTELKNKYENLSINEEYRFEVKKILQGSNFDEIECNVEKIKYRQKDNKYTNFFKNFKEFYLRLNDLDMTKVNVFSRTLLQECQVIVVVSYQTDEAIEIFNSLNSTGMPLADADILSAKVYSNYDDNKYEFTQRWGEIVRATNSLGAQRISTIDDILNQYMYILRARHYEKDTTIPGVRRYFTSSEHGKEALNSKNFISDIEKIINIWQDKDSNDKLITLKRILLQHSSNFKFYYATYMYFKQSDPIEKKQEFVETLLKLFAILSILEVGYSTSAFKSFLITDLNMSVGNNEPTDELIEKINSHIRKSFKKDDIYEAIVTSNPDNAVVYLNEYLFAKEIGANINFDIPKIEIEHIMPSSGKNIISIREDAGMDEEEFKQYVNLLGNKILLEQNINAAVGNGWFQTKKQQAVAEKRGYKDSIFPLAQSLTKYPQDVWKKEDIEKATNKAAARIVKFIFE